jgi:hypothetical protein
MDEIQTFFAKYAVALSSGDAKRIAPFYAPKFMMEGQQGRQMLSNNGKFRGMLKAADKYYRKRGLTQLKIAKFSKAELGQNYMITQVEWLALHADGSEGVRYDVTYVVVMHPHPQIVFFISHNEHDRLKAKGLA